MKKNKMIPLVNVGLLSLHQQGGMNLLKSFKVLKYFLVIKKILKLMQ